MSIAAIEALRRVLNEAVPPESSIQAMTSPSLRSTTSRLDPKKIGAEFLRANLPSLVYQAKVREPPRRRYPRPSMTNALPKRASEVGSGTPGGWSGVFWNSNDPKFVWNFTSNSSVPPATSVPKSTVFVPAGNPVRFSVKLSLPGCAAPLPSGARPPLAPPEQFCPPITQTSTFMKPGKVLSSATLWNTEAPDVVTAAASGTVSNPQEVRRILCQSAALSEPWAVVLLIVTLMLRSTKPPPSVVNTGFEKAATPVRVTPAGGVLSFVAQIADEQLQSTSNGAVPAVTGIAEPGPAAKAIVHITEVPISNPPAKPWRSSFPSAWTTSANWTALAGPSLVVIGLRNREDV